MTVTTPPTGTQDLIAVNKNTFQRIALEITKPIRSSLITHEYPFLNEFKGQFLNEQCFQQVVDALIGNDFDVYLEHPLATAEHETFEEHGVDLRKSIGKDNHRVVCMFEFDPLTIKAKRGLITQKIYVAHLDSAKDIKLNYTDKVEEKIQVNRGRNFYEKGTWGSLTDFKMRLEQEKKNLQSNIDSSILNEQQKNLMSAELTAFENRLNVIEGIESTIASYLNQAGYSITSTATANKLEITSYHRLAKVDSTNEQRARFLYARMQLEDKLSPIFYRRIKAAQQGEVHPSSLRLRK